MSADTTPQYLILRTLLHPSSATCLWETHCRDLSSQQHPLGFRELGREISRPEFTTEKSTYEQTL